MRSSKQSPHTKFLFVPSFFRRRASSFDFPASLSIDTTANVFGLNQKKKLVEKQQRSKSLTLRKLNKYREHYQSNSPRGNTNGSYGICSRCGKESKLAADHRGSSNTQGRSGTCDCQDDQLEQRESNLHTQSTGQSGSRARQPGRRIKDSEDYITVKYPSPSTGPMTLSVINDSGRETTPSPDSRGFPASRAKSQRYKIKWRRDSHSWYNDEPTVPSSITQSLGTMPKRFTSVNIEGGGDPFIIKMPTAREPAPYEHPGKTESQSKECKNAHGRDSILRGRQKMYDSIPNREHKPRL
jgi:hypothetical protein